MLAASIGLKTLISGIENAVELYRQKSKNDTESEQQAVALQANLNTLNSLQKKLEDRFKKRDEEDKEMWGGKLKMLQMSLDNFMNSINARKKQCWLRKMLCAASQRNEIRIKVVEFHRILEDFNKFLDNMVKCEQLDDGKQTVENTKRTEENTQQIAENTSDQSRKHYEIPQLAESIKSKYETDPELWKLNKGLPVQEYYINLAIVENKQQREKEKNLEKAKDYDDIRGTYEEIYGTKTTILAENIFKNSKNPKQVLLLGRAGIGKSTFCKHVINRWAQGELWPEYKLVILIQLRKLTKERYSADTYSVLDIVNKEYRIDVKPSDAATVQFKEQCKKGEILWILDGYDEFMKNTSAAREAFKEIIDEYDYILTSRPYAIDYADDVIRMEITGFTDDNIVAFVKQYFKLAGESSQDSESKYKTVLNFLKSNPTIWGIAHIPINLYLICTTSSDPKWFEKKGLTVTDLYHEVVYQLCRKHLLRQDGSKKQISKNQVQQKCGEHLQFLENVAFDALISNNIILEPELLAKIANDTKCPEEMHEESLNIGVLKSYDGDQSNDDQAETDKQHYFIHLSFQEFFAARHLVRILSSAKEDAHHFIQENKYNQRFTLVFIFAFGLLRHQNNQKLIDDYWNSIENKARDLIGLRHIKLLIESLDEMTGNLYSEIRTDCIHSIVPWINRAVKKNRTMVRRHLCNSFIRTTTLAREKEIISTLKKLSESPDYDVRSNDLILLCVSHMPQPSTELVLLVIERTRQENCGVLIRLNACKALGKIGKEGDNSEVIDALLKVLTGDNDSRVKTAACEALGEIGMAGDSSKAIDALLKVFADNMNVDVKKAACRALGEVGKAGYNSKVIDDLLKILGDNKDRDVKNAACRALGKIGKAGDNSKVIYALLEVVTNKENWNVRWAAHEALGEIGKAGDNSKMIDALLKVLNDNADSVVKEAACEALGEIGKAGDNSKMIDALLKVLTDNNHSGVKETACDALGKIDKAGDNSRVIYALLKILTDDENSRVKNAAYQALGKIGKAGGNRTAIDVLLNVLTNGKDIEMKNAAYKALGEIGKAGDNSKVTDALLKVLIDNADSGLRGAACEALGEIGKAEDNGEVVDALLKVLTDNNHSGVKRTACEALGKIGKAGDNSKAIDALLKVLTGNDDSGVKWTACEALGEISKAGDNSKVIDALLQVLTDNNDINVKNAACRALGKISKTRDNTKVIDALLKVLTDNNHSIVKETACDALGKISKVGDNSNVINAVLEVLQGNANSGVRRAACEALGKIGKAEDNSEVIKGLLKVLKDNPDNEVKNAACTALGKIGRAGDNSEVIYGIVTALKNKSSSEHFLFGALKKCLLDFKVTEGLNDELIATLDFYIKRCHRDLQEVSPAIFLRAYLKSGKKSWLHLAIFVALVQGVAVTVEDKLVVYGGKESIALEKPTKEALKEIMDVCQE